MVLWPSIMITSKLGRPDMGEISSSIRQQSNTCAWSPPQDSTIQIHLNGAIRPYIAAASAVARDSEGRLIQCMSKRIHTSDPMTVEAESLKLGLILRSNLSPNSLIIEGDALNIARLIADPQKDIPWRIRAVIQDCRTLLQDASNTTVVFTPRSANEAAHLLAKFSVTNFNLSFDVWNSSLAPPCVLQRTTFSPGGPQGGVVAEATVHHVQPMLLVD